MKEKLKKIKINPGILFISPWLIGFVVLVAWPLAQSFFFSLNSIRLRPTGRVYIFEGLNNYRNIWLKDMFFVQELLSFFLSSLLRVPVIVVFSLIIALLLNRDMKHKSFFRTLFFLPVIISSGPVMNQLINEGATAIPMIDINSMEIILESALPIWLAGPIISLFSQIIIVLWYSGVQILIFIAALQKIDHSLYEAAEIDGASGWECFWKITLPTLKPMILLNAIYTLITLANSGQNEIITLIYNNMFSATRGYGFASAMAWMYAVIILIMIGIIFLLFSDKNDRRVKKANKQAMKKVLKEEELKGKLKISKKLKKIRKG